MAEGGPNGGAKQVPESESCIGSTGSRVLQLLDLERMLIQSVLRTKGTTEEKPVPSSKIKNLGDLMLWLYGRDSSETPSLIRSQNPDLKTLDTVLLTETGIEALRDGLPLSVAHDISQGDERLFRQALQQAKQSLQKALGTLTTGFNATDTDMLKIAGDIESLAHDLVEAMTIKKSRDRREEKNKRN